MNNPPGSLKDFIELYAQIANGEHSIRLKPRSLAILKSMIDAPEEAAAKSISELAEEHGLHISSITRLSQKLGYNGFHQLRNVFRGNLREKRKYYSDQVKELLQKQDGGPETEEATVMNRVVTDELGNILRMLDKGQDEQFSLIVDKIKNARHLAILGLRGCYPVAYFFAFYLRMIRDHVSLLGQAGNTIAEDLAKLDEQSLLITISVPPYTKSTISACRVCKENHIPLIAITDNPASPLAAYTNDVLATPIEGSYFFSPIAAMMLCIESLLAELVVQLGDDALIRINRTEKILNRLDIEQH